MNDEKIEIKRTHNENIEIKRMNDENIEIMRMHDSNDERNWNRSHQWLHDEKHSFEMMNLNDIK